MNSRRPRGFALPTVLIVSIVMLTVLLAAVSSTAAIRSSLTAQYYGQLSQAAGDAGVAYAKACLADNNNIPKWDNSDYGTAGQKLMPNTNCSGVALADCSVLANLKNNPICSVSVNDNNVIATFAIPKPQLDSTGKASTINSSGMVNLLRTSNNSDVTPWRQYSQAVVSKLNTPTISALVVAGGGGGSNTGSGGGAGGYVYNPSLEVTSQSYPVVVGGGGAGGVGTAVPGAKGGNSTFSNITAIGGGNGVTHGGNTGGNGGSGGGGSMSDTNPVYAAGGVATSGQGFGGGIGYMASGWVGTNGGGGGAASAGSAGGNWAGAGNGGNGLPNSISGSSVYYAGGGGGGEVIGSFVGTGGYGGGGTAVVDGAGGNATPNTGGGGAGGSYNAGIYNNGGNGGSGIVIISYPTGSMTATGGVVSVVGSNTIHTFKNSGTFTVLPTLASVKLLVVAGGGGGGSFGGGGGAGGLIYSDSYAIGSQTYPITVGGGGSGAATSSNGIPGNNGQNSTFGILTAIGGGGGGTRNGPSALPVAWGAGSGASGGSGGGSSNGATGSTAAIGFAPIGQGNNGGQGSVGSGAPYAHGGGGGAGSVGGNGVSFNGGPGGSGLAYSITGSLVCYAGGGGGGTYNDLGSIVGVGGSCTGGGSQSGGTGQSSTPGGVGGAGLANTGGGGGGGGYLGIGGAGGSGVVVVSYPTGYMNATATGTYTIIYTDSSNNVVGSAVSGGSTIYRFASNGTFTPIDIIKDGSLMLNLDANNINSISPNVHPYATDLFSWVCNGANPAAGNNSTLYRDSIASPVGNTPLKMVVSGLDPYTISYNSPKYNLFPTSSGKTWTVSVWAKANTTTTGQLFLLGANSSGVAIESGAVTINLSTDWKRYSYTYTTSNASTAYIQSRLDGTDAGGSATIWWDGIQVEQNNSMSDFNKYSIGMNIHPNSTNLYSWVTTGNNVALSRDAIASPVGSTPLKMVVNGTGVDPFATTNGASQYNLYQTAPNRTWTASVWAKADANTTGQIYLLGADSTGVNTVWGALNFNITTSWQKFTYTYTTSGATTAYIQARLDGPDSGGLGRTIWWDGLQVKEGANLTSTWNDLSGHGNNANLMNNPIYSNGSLAFNGSNDYAVIPATITVNNLNSLNSPLPGLTTSVWVYPTVTDNTWRRFISRDSSPSQNWYTEFYGSPTTPGFVNYNAGNTSATKLLVNNWYDITTVYNGTNVSLYVNGVFDTTFPYTGPSTSIAPIGIGADPNNTGNFAGKISSVLIYNRPLSSVEIMQNFNAVRSIYGL